MPANKWRKNEIIRLLPMCSLNEVMHKGNDDQQPSKTYEISLQKAEPEFDQASDFHY